MKTIWLEFQNEGATGLAANGTDVTFFLDGRWSPTTAREKIYEQVAALRAASPYAKRYRNQLFVGYSISGSRPYSNESPHFRMPDRNPPAWVSKEV